MLSFGSLYTKSIAFQNQGSYFLLLVIFLDVPLSLISNKQGQAAICVPRSQEQGLHLFCNLKFLCLQEDPAFKKKIIIEILAKVLCFLVKLCDVTCHYRGPWYEPGRRRRFPVGGPLLKAGQTE